MEFARAAIATFTPLAERPERVLGRGGAGHRLVRASRTRCSSEDESIYGRWFADGTCNTCYNAVDRHVAAERGQQAALSTSRPVTNAQQPHLSPAIVRGAVPRRDAARVRRRERATPSSSTCRWCRKRCSAMLACARIGAIHSVVFGGFAAKELATRVNDSRPKLILSASSGIEGAAHHSLVAFVG